MSDNQTKKEEQEPTEQAEQADYKQKADEYLDNWKRERADFLNYKKDETRRLEEFAKFANEDVLLEVMEIVDDLELAAKELKDMGLEQVSKKFQELFKKYGIERIQTDVPFNPMMHEAVETEPGGTKLEEVRAGYMMRDKVIRPSRVRIIK